MDGDGIGRCAQGLRARCRVPALYSIGGLR